MCIRDRYYEPITVKIDVEPKYKDILEFMKRSVKPAEDVRAWMEEKIRTHSRAPMRFLPLRLPHKSQIVQAEDQTKEDIVVETQRPRKSTMKKEKVIEAVEDKTRDDEPTEGIGRRRSVKKTVRISDVVG